MLQSSCTYIYIHIYSYPVLQAFGTEHRILFCVAAVKLTSKDGSQEDLTASSEENQTKIRNRLKKFFHRRPSKDVLVKKGIYKGNYYLVYSCISALSMLCFLTMFCMLLVCICWFISKDCPYFKAFCFTQ